MWPALVLVIIGGVVWLIYLALAAKHRGSELDHELAELAESVRAQTQTADRLASSLGEMQDAISEAQQIISFELPADDSAQRTWSDTPIHASRSSLPLPLPPNLASHYIRVSDVVMNWSELAGLRAGFVTAFAQSAQPFQSVAEFFVQQNLTMTSTLHRELKLQLASTHALQENLATLAKCERELVANMHGFTWWAPGPSPLASAVENWVKVSREVTHSMQQPAAKKVRVRRRKAVAKAA
jgi:hypothetical protein